MKKLSLLVLLLFFNACDNSTPPKILDGKMLIEQKCSSCHNLDLPPKTFKDEIAPPMMAVSFHIINFIQTNNESEKVPKAIEFVKDYVINPDISKSFCDKQSLESYGLMPSQKGNVTSDELEAIAKYMFIHFTQENLSKAQETENRLREMPKGKLLAVKNGCLTCHRIDKDLVGPSFKRVALKYNDNAEVIENSIKNGSSKIYENLRGAVMPAFKNISDEDIKTIAEWILDK